MNTTFTPPTSGSIRKRRVLSQRRKDGLIRFAYDNTSQGGEDGVLNRLFELIPSPSEEDDHRWCVDVGAWDGKHLSNTYSLLVPPEDGDDSDNGVDEIKRKTSCWKGILIEADAEKCIQLENLHHPLDNICIQTTVSCQPHSPRSLVNTLSPYSSSRSSSRANDNHKDNDTMKQQQQQQQLPLDFDFLCIDVDGPDYWLLHDILHTPILVPNKNKNTSSNQSSKRYNRPKVICIEFNPTMPQDIIYIQPRNDVVRHGSSLAALVELCTIYGYQLVETTLYNAFFVREDYYTTYVKKDIPFAPCLEYVQEVTMGTNLYQLYDGTLKLNGCQKLLWHRKPILEEEIQVLDKQKRGYFPFAPTTSTNDDDNDNVDECQNGSGEEELWYNEEELAIHSIAVDMSPYCNNNTTSDNEQHDHQQIQNDDERKRQCSNQILEQLQQDGFAFVRGTGISQETCRYALQWTNSFLQDAPEKVRRSCLTKDRARRGYSPQNSENFASLIGEKGANDLVRKFRVGPSCDNTNDSGNDDEVVVDQEHKLTSSSSLLQPNAWPDKELWEGNNAADFQASIQRYYDHLCDIAHAIVTAICDGISNNNSRSNSNNLDETTESVEDTNGLVSAIQSLNTCITHTSILTLLGYRKGARHQGKHSRPLIAAHTDVGVITVLLFDGGGENSCAMLQRKDGTATSSSSSSQVNETNNWVNVTLPHSVPRDPVFVVNIGDCLSDLTGSLLPSTLHRVMPWKGGETHRNCLALFVGLSPDEKLVLPSSLSDHGDSISTTTTTTMTYEEWRRQRIAKASAVLNKN